MDRLLPQKFTFEGHDYLVGRLNLFDAMKLQKRVGPLMPTVFNQLIFDLWQAAAKSKDESKATLSDRLVEFGTLLNICQPLLDRIAAMPDEDLVFVLSTCLSVVERQSDDKKTWTRVWQNGAIIFDDISIANAYVLVSAVLQRELRPFADAMRL